MSEKEIEQKITEYSKKTGELYSKLLTINLLDDEAIYIQADIERLENKIADLNDQLNESLL